MNAIVLILLVLVVIVVLAATAFGIALVRSSRRQLTRDTDLPFPSRAPDRWAVSHEPEAKLHRRLRDAVRVLDGNRGMLGAAALDEQVQITIAAQDLDDQLVSMAPLADEAKAEALAGLDAQVADLERRVAAVVLPPASGPTVPGLPAPSPGTGLPGTTPGSAVPAPSSPQPQAAPQQSAARRPEPPLSG
jgi:hypothetical protein